MRILFKKKVYLYKTFQNQLGVRIALFIKIIRYSKNNIRKCMKFLTKEFFKNIFGFAYIQLQVSLFIIFSSDGFKIPVFFHVLIFSLFFFVFVGSTVQSL